MPADGDGGRSWPSGAASVSRGTRRRARAVASGIAGKAKRKRRGSKKRRKRGDKSKNGKEVVVVVMYTLAARRGRQTARPASTRSLYATFAGRKAAALWARAEATKRGFGPDTTKTVQIVLDGAKSLKENLKPLFPKAIFTLDVCHVVEKLWALGRHYHKEGSTELAAWVEELKELVYGGTPRPCWNVSCAGCRVRCRRAVRARKVGASALTKLIGYVQPRQRMMRYAHWMEQDLVIATGQVEGAVRHLVGERLDCSGMRWIRQERKRCCICGASNSTAIGTSYGYSGTGSINDAKQFRSAQTSQ